MAIREISQGNKDMYWDIAALGIEEFLPAVCGYINGSLLISQAAKITKFLKAIGFVMSSNFIIGTGIAFSFYMIAHSAKNIVNYWQGKELDNHLNMEIAKKINMIASLIILL